MFGYWCGSMLFFTRCKKHSFVTTSSRELENGERLVEASDSVLSIVFLLDTFYSFQCPNATSDVLMSFHWL